MDFGKLAEILLATAIPILVPVVLVFLRTWLKQRQKEIEQSIGFERWWAIEEAIKTAVRAAEQAGIREGLEKAGARKKQWAISSAEAFLSARGLEGLNLGVLADLIEAEVHRTINGK